MKYQIYGLCDPDTGEVRYIGKANNAQDRFKRHMREFRRKYPVYAWRDKLLKSGKMPRLIILAETDGDWRDLERSFIAEYRASGARLLNIADGGDEPSCSKEQLSKNAKKLNNMQYGGDAFMTEVRRIRMAGVSYLRSGVVNEEVKAKFRMAALKRPDLFGCFLKYTQG